MHITSPPSRSSPISDVPWPARSFSQPAVITQSLGRLRRAAGAGADPLLYSQRVSLPEPRLSAALPMAFSAEGRCEAADE